jgi:uncharacterized protein (DUF849 family)
MVARIERIKACLNGRRDISEHPAVPVTPAQLGDAASTAVAAGAEALHLHPRDAGGRESPRAADVGAAVGAVRAACEGVPVGVTTGLWAADDARSRHELVAAWAGLDLSQRPDFASVNVGEDGWQQLAETLAATGISPEAGVWSVADADAIAGYDPPGGWLRIMVEVSGVSADRADPYAREILSRLASVAPQADVLLHGDGASCWPLIVLAGGVGLPTRIGLEDVTAGPAGEPVRGNAELVRLAIGVWTAARGAGV